MAASPTEAQTQAQASPPTKGSGGGGRGAGRRRGRGSYGAPWEAAMPSPFPDWWGYWMPPSHMNGPHINGSGPKRFADAASAEKDTTAAPASLEKLSPEKLLGSWADSLGNRVHVYATDAYEARLIATLCRPPRPDVHLRMFPEGENGWRCGNSVLDPVWSSSAQLHWVTADGRVSVWVRLQDQDPDGSNDNHSKFTLAADAKHQAEEKKGQQQQQQQQQQQEQKLEPEQQQEQKPESAAEVLDKSKVDGT